MQPPTTPTSEKKGGFWKISVPKIPGSMKPLNFNASLSPDATQRNFNPGSPTSDYFEEGYLVSKTAEDVFGATCEEPVLPDIPESSFEARLRELYLDDGKGADPEGDKYTAKKRKFLKLYQATNVDLDELKKLSWSGIPYIFRPWAWKLLMGYMPLNKDRRQTTLERKRKDYNDCVHQYFGIPTDAEKKEKESDPKEVKEGVSKDGEQREKEEYPNVDHSIFHQIQLDVPRTNPDVPLYHSPITRKCLERILYVWTIRHPASGYVQGINDLLTPFFSVFLSQHIEGDPDTCEIAQVDKEILDIVEADSYWCLSKLVDGIQDSYTTSQPGIQRQVHKLKELVGRLDAPLHDHLQNQGIEFIQFSFRWMNCLLMRETPLKNIIRMWDTYMAEGVDGYSTFHVYVCAAFLISWAKEVKRMEFAELMTFLQNPPSQSWTFKEIEVALSQAFMWQSLFQNAQSHLH